MRCNLKIVVEAAKNSTKGSELSMTAIVVEQVSASGVAKRHDRRSGREVPRDPKGDFVM
jgi:hypothetical protein